jgi:hypothetical protein
VTWEVFGQSQHFTVSVIDELVFLEGPAFSGSLLIGGFDTKMTDAAIDPDEKWCVLVGDGVIVYNLRSPWEPYSFDAPTPSPSDDPYAIYVRQPSNQYWECGRGGFRVPALWLIGVEYIEGERFEVEAANSKNPSAEGPTRFALFADSMNFRPINWLPDII